MVVQIQRSQVLILRTGTRKGAHLLGVFRSSFETWWIIYVFDWPTVSALTRRLFWSLFPELWSNKGIEYQNNTRVTTETVRHESTYIMLFLTRHNKSINDDNQDALYTSSPCLTRAVLVPFCSWRHNLLLMTLQRPDDSNAITGIVIFTTGRVRKKDRWSSKSQQNNDFDKTTRIVTSTMNNHCSQVNKNLVHHSSDFIILLILI